MIEYNICCLYLLFRICIILLHTTKWMSCSLMAFISLSVHNIGSSYNGQHGPVRSGPSLFFDFISCHFPSFSLILSYNIYLTFWICLLFHFLFLFPGTLRPQLSVSMWLTSSLHSGLCSNVILSERFPWPCYQNRISFFIFFVVVLCVFMKVVTALY